MWFYLLNFSLVFLFHGYNSSPPWRPSQGLVLKGLLSSAPRLSFLCVQLSFLFAVPPVGWTLSWNAWWWLVFSWHVTVVHVTPKLRTVHLDWCVHRWAWVTGRESACCVWGPSGLFSACSPPSQLSRPQGKWGPLEAGCVWVCLFMLPFTPVFHGPGSAATLSRWKPSSLLTGWEWGPRGGGPGLLLVDVPPAPSTLWFQSLWGFEL